MQSHGAVYGPGIYMAVDGATALGYAAHGNVGLGWQSSQFGASVKCIALCEVVNHGDPDLKKCQGKLHRPKCKHSTSSPHYRVEMEVPLPLHISFPCLKSRLLVTPSSRYPATLSVPSPAPCCCVSKPDCAIAHVQVQRQGRMHVQPLRRTRIVMITQWQPHAIWRRRRVPVCGCGQPWPCVAQTLIGRGGPLRTPWPWIGLHVNPQGTGHHAGSTYVVVRKC